MYLKSTKKRNEKNPKDDSVTNTVWRLVKYTQGHNEDKTLMKFNLPLFVRVDDDMEDEEDEENGGGGEKKNKKTANANDDVTYDIKILATLPV